MADDMNDVSALLKEDEKTLQPWEKAVVEAIRSQEKADKRWVAVAKEVKSFFEDRQNVESKDATRRINQLMFLGLSKEDQKVFTRLEEIGSKPYGVPEKNDVTTLRNRKKAIQQKL